MPRKEVSKVRISDLLDRPIAFHRALVPVAGGVLPALMLSQALYWSKRTTQPGGWFYKTRDEWEAETGMGRREQETARKRLRETGFWKEELRGVPAKLYYLIDLDALEKALLGVPSSWADSAQLESANPPNRKGGKRPTITEITTEITSETTKKKSSSQVDIEKGEAKRKSAFLYEETEASPQPPLLIREEGSETPEDDTADATPFDWAEGGARLALRLRAAKAPKKGLRLLDAPEGDKSPATGLETALNGSLEESAKEFYEWDGWRDGDWDSAYEG